MTSACLLYFCSKITGQVTHQWKKTQSCGKYKCDITMLASVVQELLVADFAVKITPAGFEGAQHQDS